jgi:type I restriction enzyme S subunit
MGTQLNLNTDTVGDIRIPLPPYEEQNSIVESLISKIGMNQQLVDKIQNSIDLLKEYRSSLITHAVSGQIDITKSEVSK